MQPGAAGEREPESPSASPSAYGVATSGTTSSILTTLFPGKPTLKDSASSGSDGEPSTSRWKWYLGGFVSVTLVVVAILVLAVTGAYGWLNDANRSSETSNHLVANAPHVSNPLVAKSTKAPHIVFIMADDLGWGNVGYHNFGNKQIRTTKMDYLVKTGLELNRMYVYRGCAPTRSSFQTGRLPIHVTTSNGDGISDPMHGIPAAMTGIASKLQSVGYKTYLIGKWDAGFATWQQLPIFKGYDYFYGYLGKTIDYFDKTSINDCPNLGDRDLWENDHPAFGQPTNGADGEVLEPSDLSLDPNGEAGEYIEFAFEKKALEIIENYDDNGENPLFLVYSSHLPHMPMMIPEEYLEDDPYDDDQNDCAKNTDYVFPIIENTTTDIPCRTVLQSQVNLLDDIVGEIVNALIQKGIWDDTLLIFQSDNGGSIQTESAAGNNYPLRGGKLTDFEGGIRAAAFVNGGWLPDERRGKKENGLMHIADWYTTFCAMLDIDATDRKAAAAGLPAVDGLDMWPLISGQVSTSPRTEIVISDHTLIYGDYKLMVGNHNYAVWQNEVWPTSLTPPQDVLRDTTLSCVYPHKTCLFNVMEDPQEMNNLATAYPELVEQLKDKLDVYIESFYENDRQGTDSCPDSFDLTVSVGKGRSSTEHLDCGCWMSVYNYNYFNGPYQDLPPEYILFDADNFDYATMDALLQQIREMNINAATLEERKEKIETIINHAWVITRQHAAQVDLTGLYWFVLLGAFILMLMLIFAKYSNFKTRIEARSQFYESLS